jgi:hypothetical protein
VKNMEGDTLQQGEGHSIKHIGNSGTSAAEHQDTHMRVIHRSTREGITQWPNIERHEKEQENSNVSCSAYPVAALRIKDPSHVTTSSPAHAVGKGSLMQMHCSVQVPAAGLMG